ncbi:MAG TPA: hypothetical protein PK725_09990 [Rhodocyclaceae bacterium]|nr:hypothetical protein [Rhodocyclaceae bacterium]HRQ47269.1 hypothetical protein [Rhodocyclaceae bacterium]
MNLCGRTATCLELAVAPTSGRHQATIRLHPVGGEASAYLALSLDGRWVCTGRQRLTVLTGIDAALHFLRVLQIDDFRSGERAEDAAACDGSRHCLHLHVRKCLATCPLVARAPRDDAA